MPEPSENRINKKPHNRIKNKGTGAGGANTNKNGLTFEKNKGLDSEYTIKSNNNNHKVIKFKHKSNIEGITGKKSQFQKYLKVNENKEYAKLRLSGTKQPDNWFIIEKNIFILEFKFQQSGGSVLEKLQTASKKIENLTDRYVGDKYKKIVYIYILSPWFKENCAAELYYLNKDNIKIIWSDSDTFKQDVVDYMVNYK